ncbi:unnamed protein product [Bemisia tabaci]|uniref:DNA-directed DNA polymerase n=1 Tax=Bemisia tabaci TaxID=7038 RepID=A0A9P0AEX4_BEMTA|nr:unnamed protein product [Bemisia tabaci]
MKKSDLVDAIKNVDRIINAAFNFDDSFFEPEIENPSSRNDTQLIEITESRSRFIQKYQAYSCDYTISIKDSVLITQPTADEQTSLITRALEEMIEMAKKRTNFRTGDRINIVIMNDELRMPISTGFQRGNVTQDLVQILMDTVSRILTSNEDLDLTTSLFHIEVVAMPQGGKGEKILNLAQAKQTKLSITQIKNKDNLCCPRAVIVALTYPMENPPITNIFKREFSKLHLTYIRKGRKLQTDLTNQLCNQLGEYNEEGFTLDDIKHLEELINIQINVVCAENLNSVIYRGPEKEIKVYLYKHGNHFDVISSMAGFIGSSYYCYSCNKPYDHKDKHTCKPEKKRCRLCFQEEHLDSTKNKIFCKDCNRYCFNQDCFDNHQEVCDTVFKCLACNKICFRDNKTSKENILKYSVSEENHQCGIEKCRNCFKEVEIKNHKCYMQWKRQKGGKCKREVCLCKGNLDQLVKPVKDYNLNELRAKGKKEEIKDCGKMNKQELLNILNPFPFANEIFGEEEEKKLPQCTYTEKYLFFDYEAQQETGIHIPNLVIVHDFYGNKHEFKTNDDFCKWLISKEHRNYTCIAHYAKIYDSQFILKYCVENTLKPYTIYNGTKLMLLEIPSIGLKIIDSGNFVNGPLSDFPKTFGLTELKKGYFPHLFNTKENENYVGPIPDKKYYNYNQMKPEARKKFLEWYLQKVQENYIFDMNFQNIVTQM